MPHFTVEYSANLDDTLDMVGLCEAVRQAAVETGVFPLGGIRVRALRCEAYAIADGAADNAFVDVSLRLGKGRDLATRKAAGERIFAAIEAYLAHQFELRPFALSFEVSEIDPELSFKKNSIHTRLAAEP